MLDRDGSGVTRNGAMDNAELKVGDGVCLRGIEPEMSIVFQEVPKVFFRHGHDCWVTSVVRSADEDSLHGYGYAADFDSSTSIAEEIGHEMAEELKSNLSDEFQALWHRVKDGAFHLHVEFDYNRKGVRNYKR